MSEENDDSHHFVSAEHLCLSQDNSRLAGFIHDYADTDKIIWSRIVVYDTNTGSLLLSVAFRCCHSLCFNSDGNQVIVKEDDRLGVIDIRSGGETRLAVVLYSGYSRHAGLPIFLVPSNNAVVTTGGEIVGTNLIFWNEGSWDEVYRLSGHEFVICCLAISTTSNRMISGDMGKMMKLWDLHSYSQCGEFLLEHVAETVCIIEQGNMFACNGYDTKKGVVLISIGTCEIVAVVRTNADLYGLHILPSSSVLICKIDRENTQLIMDASLASPSLTDWNLERYEHFGCVSSCSSVILM
jgi:WD40 repeat protein